MDESGTGPAAADARGMETLRGALREAVASSRPLLRGLAFGAAIGALAGIAIGGLALSGFAAAGRISPRFFCPPALWYGIAGLIGGLPAGLVLGARAGLVGAARRALLPVFESLAGRLAARAAGAESDPAGDSARDAAPAAALLTRGWRGRLLNLAVGRMAGRALAGAEGVAREGDAARRRAAVDAACRSVAGALGDALLALFTVPVAVSLLLALAMLLLPPAFAWLC
jgi:hypothetical protein